MTRKLKILLISVLLSVATVCVCAFAGCKVKYTVDELKEKYGLTAQITYFLNSDGGKFNGSPYVKNLYYNAGDKPMDIMPQGQKGSTSFLSGSTQLKMNAGFNFTGWYKVETDKDGHPLYAADENGEKKVYSDGDNYDVKRGMSMTDEPFDFKEPLKDGDHIYLCGDFYPDVKLKINLLCEGDDSFDHVEYTFNKEKVSVKNGEEITDESTTIPKKDKLDDFSSDLKDKFDGCTFVGFYQKVEGTTDQYVQFNGWPIKYPDPDEKGEYHDIIIYAKVIQGKWNIVNTPNDVKQIFNFDSGNSYYIKQDIDGNGTTLYPLSSFSGKIWGGKDGHTLKNFVVEDSSATGVLSQDAKASMFGTIVGSAVFENVTFENFTVNFTVGSRGTTTIDANVKFIANEIESGATFKNFNVSGSLNIKLSSVYSEVNNTTQDDWLFGNKDDATFKEITVTQATCTITDKDGETVDTFTINNNNQTEDL